MTRLRKKYKKLKQRYEKMCSLPFVPEFKFESPKLQTFCTRKIISKQNANKAMLEYYDKTAVYELVEGMLKHGYVEREVTDPLKEYGICGSMEHSLFDNDFDLIISYSVTVAAPLQK